MKKIVMLAATLTAVIAPVQASAAPSTEKQAAEEKQAATAKKKGDDFDLAKMMAMFDKVFPAQPDPAPGRLALAQATAGGMFPNGTYAGLFDDMMNGMVDRILAIDPAEFAAKGAKPKAGTPATLREEITKGDPHFEERMRIMRRVVGEEVVKVSALLEPKLREGLARSIARRFDEKQLTEINAFLATDSGRAFAGQTMRLWVDPDVMRSMMQTMPHMIAAMPGAMMRLEAETKHLPKPKKKEAAETKEEPAG